MKFDSWVFRFQVAQYRYLFGSYEIDPCFRFGQGADRTGGQHRFHRCDFDSRMKKGVDGEGHKDSAIAVDEIDSFGENTPAASKRELESDLLSCPGIEGQSGRSLQFHAATGGADREGLRVIGVVCHHEGEVWVLSTMADGPEIEACGLKAETGWDFPCGHGQVSCQKQSTEKTKKEEP